MYVTKCTRAALCAVWAGILLLVVVPGRAESPAAGPRTESLDPADWAVIVLPEDGSDPATRILLPGEEPLRVDPYAGVAPVFYAEPFTFGDGLRASQCDFIGTGANPFSSLRAWQGNVVGIGSASAGKKLTEIRVQLSSSIAQTTNLTFTVYKLNRNLTGGNQYEPVAIQRLNNAALGAPALYGSGVFNNGAGIILQTETIDGQTFEGRYALGIGWDAGQPITYKRDTGVLSFDFGVVVGYFGFGSAPPAPGSTTPRTINPLASNSLYMQVCVEAPPGACCLPNNTCQPAFDRAVCESLGGQFTQADLQCSEVSCPLPQGACCTGTVCDYTNEFECIDPEQLNGESWEQDRDCAPYNPCGPQRGACCEVDGDCTDEVTQVDCLARDGLWQGIDSTCNASGLSCPARGACCLPGGGCSLVTPAGCNPTQGQVFQGIGSRCQGPNQPINTCSTAKGACCLYDGECLAINDGRAVPTQVTQYECAYNTTGTAGTWSSGASCEAANCDEKVLGACCATSGSCADKTLANCFECRDALASKQCPNGFVLTTNGFCPVLGTNPGECRRPAEDFDWYEGRPCAYGACLDEGLVGACCYLGECEITNEVTCLNQGGVFTNAGTNAFEACNVNGTPTDCSATAGTGACCQTLNGDHFCEILSESACNATATGYYAGDGIDCSGIVCATGICCDPADNCSTAPATVCAAGGNEPGAPGTACPTSGPNPCKPSGACCFEDATCRVLNEDQCLADGGHYQGDDVACGENLCPFYGACCLEILPGNYVCNYRSQTACENAANGHFAGPLTECIPNACQAGSCCELDGTCAEEFRTACVEKPDAVFNVGGTCTPNTCEERGACCTTNGCDITTPADCSSNGGDFVGVGAACTADVCDTVACCIGSSCQDLRASTCVNTSGMPGPVGSDCQTTDYCTPGACCVNVGTPQAPDYICASVNLIQCDAAGGVFNGAGTVCDANACTGVGACCLPGGTCAQRLPAACAAEGGTFRGAGASCGANTCTKVPCCLGSTCSDLYTDECATMGGLAGPSGETCGSADYCTDGACCVGSGPATCDEAVNQLECAQLSGTFQGPGSSCTPDPCNVTTTGVCCRFRGECDDNGGAGYTQAQCEAFVQATFIPGGDCATASCTNKCANYPGGPHSDWNRDGEVDLVDFAAFQRCFGNTFSWECTCTFDIDEDGAVELDPEFQQFELDLRGPGANCAPYVGYELLDVQNDGKWDLSDYAVLQACFGPNTDPLCHCVVDADRSGETDLVDYHWLSIRLEGPNP